MSITDIPTLFSIANTKATNYEDTLLNKQELATLCGLDDPGRIIGWSDKDTHILKPKRGIRGSVQNVLKFDKNEITKALVATELERRAWKPRHIASVMELWEAGKLTSVFASPASTLDQTGRAVTIIRARLLSAIMIKLCGVAEMPPDCQLVFRKCQPPELFTEKLQLSVLSPELAFTIFQEQNALVGWSVKTEDREINIVSRPGEEFNKNLSGRDFYRLLVGDEFGKQWSEIIVGITTDVNDQESRLLRDSLRRGVLGITQTSNDYHLVARCISILQNILPRMELKSADKSKSLSASQVNDVQSVILSVILSNGGTQVGICEFVGT